MARSCFWTDERIVEAIARWVQATGRFPRHDDLAAARTTSNRDAFFSLELPSVRTIQKRWSWPELRGVYARLGQTWRAIFRDPWSGEPVEFLDWEDVGYKLPILDVDVWYRRFASLHPSAVDDDEAFWRWARACDYVYAVPTFAGGLLSDLPEQRRRAIRAARHRDDGLHPPRVLRYAGGDDWHEAPRLAAENGQLSRSARGRVEQRMARYPTGLSSHEPRPRLKREARYLPADATPEALAWLAEQYREGLEHNERERQSFKQDLAKWEFWRPEWTDHTDATPFYTSTCEGVSMQPVIPVCDIDGNDRYLSEAERRAGTCRECGGRFPALRSLHERAYAGLRCGQRE